MFWRERVALFLREPLERLVLDVVQAPPLRGFFFGLARFECQDTDFLLVRLIMVSCLLERQSTESDRARETERGRETESQRDSQREREFQRERCSLKGTVSERESV